MEDTEDVVTYPEFNLIKDEISVLGVDIDKRESSS